MAAAKRNLVSALVGTLLLWVPTVLWGADTPDPATVTIAGDLQSELGCPGDWQTDCVSSHLAFDAGVWQGVFNVPAGSWEYKAALNDSWDENYGANAQRDGANIPLDLGAPVDVKFYYDHESHWITDNVNSVIATVPGDFQSALGCPGNWQPDCLRSWLQDPDGDGIYGFTTDAIPAGNYEAKVAHDEAWNENYGQGGAANGANILFSVGAGEVVTFAYDPGTHILTISTAPPPPPPPAQFDYAIIHYLRPAGDYGTPSADYNTFWGLHLWGDAIDPSEGTDWTQPKPFEGEDEFGRFAWMRRSGADSQVNFIIHRGDTKDTDPDRGFDADAYPEVWIHQGDTTIYTSQAEAQGFVTVHYHRPDGDYGDPTSPDYNDFWGLHLWGDAIDPSEGTGWTDPKPPTGFDGYGAFWEIQIVDAAQPVNFILHRGDTKDPGPDESFLPTEMATAWKQSGDVAIYPSRGAAQGFATIHYHRDDGDYGDPMSSNFNDFWGLHVWTGALNPNSSWQEPIKPVGQDQYGLIFEIPLAPGATELAYIIHRGDLKDPGPDQFLDLATYGYEVWQLSGEDPSNPDEPHYVLPIVGAAVAGGDLDLQQAHWVSADTIVWAAADDPSADYALCHAPSGGMTLGAGGIEGGTCIDLGPGTPYPAGVDGFRHLAGMSTLTIPAGSLGDVPSILTGQIAVQAIKGGVRIDATGLQIPGVLDDLYATDVPLGVVWNGTMPTLRLWAPTAKSVMLHVFDNADPATASATLPMAWDAATGTWSADGDGSWNGKYYLYDVEVYVPSTGAVEHNLVTDPYSLSLAMNSTRSQIVDLADPALAPAGWAATAKPPLARFEDIAIYELHVRDFSVNDPFVPDELKGTYKAFTLQNTNGMDHLEALADAGLTHVHLLPTFDIATIDEDQSTWQQPDPAVLATYPPDSDQQQDAVALYQDVDGFNWGYDPFHYTTPEGSYATVSDGTTRIVEFREMVQALNETGLRVVMDVVYNHTNASGQSQRSVLDRIVPGYYHRLNGDGAVATSTCCANTATEHAMMERLMVDSLVTWARAYKVDGFRFDLMGHHSLANMLEVRAALDALTVAADGVDGSSIYLYGEGWNFGEVADNSRFIQATQLNLDGTGIGTFNDRLWQAVRGGSQFDSGTSRITNQGFINGLVYDPNGLALPPATAEAEMLLSADQIRVALAGNLAAYEFEAADGTVHRGDQIDYLGSPAGYTEDPQENIVYLSAHDNETLFDISQYKHPLATSTADRARAQNLGLDLTALAQGVSFFHAGVDMLRSKSFDRDSFNSGDWFNRLDFTYQSNNWAVGLPLASANQADWPIMQPLLADPSLAPAPADIAATAAHMQEILAIRGSSPLFSLETAAAVQERVAFHNTGPGQLPGLIVMSLSDTVEPDLDPDHESIVVLFNANDATQTFVAGGASPFAGIDLALHPVQAASADPVVRTASFDKTAGTFVIPGRTTAIFVQNEILPGDLDGDGDVDRDDLTILLAARNTPASGPDDPRDLDGDGMITVLDARQLVLLCTRDRCATE
jgi:pullulanase-type alpha-1,6-glucosidase